MAIKNPEETTVIEGCFFGIIESVRMAKRLLNYVYGYIFGNGNTHWFHYFMSSYQYTSCLILRHFYSIAQRKEDACFLFSQVQPFKYGIAHPFRSV